MTMDGTKIGRSPDCRPALQQGMAQREPGT